MGLGPFFMREKGVEHSTAFSNGSHRELFARCTAFPHSALLTPNKPFSALKNKSGLQKRVTFPIPNFPRSEKSDFPVPVPSAAFRLEGDVHTLRTCPSAANAPQPTSRCPLAVFLPR